MKDEDIIVEYEESKRDFSSLLREIPYIDDHLRVLFLEIYANANVDRDAAQALFDNLVTHMTAARENVDAAHVMHGQNLTKYLERMNKANDQLMKLAEMVTDAKKAEEAINHDDVLSQIEKTTRGKKFG